MREIIDEVLNGNYGGETGALDFSVATIDASVASGEKCSGSFMIQGNGSALRGRVLSTDYRMECLTPEFAGQEAEISYSFHTEGLEAGEVVKGAFRVISNLGEYSIPFAIKCKGRRKDGGSVNNLNGFVELAKERWQDALAIFYSDSFTGILAEDDPELIPIYKGLSVYAGKEQNMEEFLIRAGKKQCVGFAADSSVLSLEFHEAEGEYQLREQELSVTRSGWGYTALNVECDGAFLYVEKDVILEDDFLGNVAKIPFYVDAAHLKPGANKGKIVLFNSYVSFEVEVNVKHGLKKGRDERDLQWKNAIVSIMRQYERFRTRRIGLKSWLDETGTLVEKLIALNDKDPMPRLFKAQILITQDSINEAQWTLSHAAELMDAHGTRNDELWAYYLYLTTLITREEEQIVQVTDEVKAIFKRNPGSWRIAWLLLYLAEEFESFPAEKLKFMERQYDRGCRSFVIYLEALQAYLSNPALLRKIGPFERQVLFYGIRRDFFSPDLAERFLELLEKEKDYSPLICRILEKLYAKRRDSRIVQHLCETLVRGGITNERALPWYEKGVEEQLRITNLYESFMSSIDPEKRKNLPKAAVLYFSYQNKLDYERSAFLYDYVLDNKVLYADVYDKYVLKCRDFVTEQIAKGRINRHLARLYVRCVTSDMITDQNAESLLKLVFTNKITVKDDRMKKVILYAKGSEAGREYPVTGGEAFAPIYGKETVLVFEDGFGNRFSEEIGVEREQYLDPELFLPDLLTKDIQEPEFDLWLVERATDEKWEESLAARALKLCSWKWLEDATKKKFCLHLMKQFYEEGKQEQLSEVMRHFNKMALTVNERMEVARYAVLQGNYGMPFEWMQKVGPYFLDANTLARLVGSLILNGQKADECLTAATWYLFLRGKASAVMLEYLSQYGDGTLKELRELWKAMLDSELDVTALEERILIQMIYVGSPLAEGKEIFERYFRTAGETNVTRAFTFRGCHDYFTQDKDACGILFRIIQDDYRAGANLPKVCKLSFLKYYAENPSEVARETDGVLDAFLREMLAEKIHFDFYRKLKNQRNLLGELSDKVIVEYRAKPGSRVRIHYVITQDGSKGEEYLSENMRDVFGGICCREFVLFFGETLQYYVTEEIGGEEKLMISDQIQCPETTPEAAGTKYGIINDLVMSQGMKNGDAMDEALEQYYFKEFCGENLFVTR